MIKQLHDHFTLNEFELFMMNHPCAVRYSVTDQRLLLRIVNTTNDLYELKRDDTAHFEEYLYIAYHYAEEYTATVQHIRRRS